MVKLRWTWLGEFLFYIDILLRYYCCANIIRSLLFILQRCKIFRNYLQFKLLNHTFFCWLRVFSGLSKSAKLLFWFDLLLSVQQLSTKGIRQIFNWRVENLTKCCLICAFRVRRKKMLNSKELKAPSKIIELILKNSLQVDFDFFYLSFFK
jgi:hypothetical protein